MISILRCCCARGAHKHKHTKILLTFDEQRGGLLDPRHLVLHDARVVARVPGLQVRDGQHRGQRVDPRHADRVVEPEVLAIAEPANNERRVAFDDETGLADAFAALDKVAEKAERLDPWCNYK